jgi:predicted RNase H-like HicB family nuclease
MKSYIAFFEQDDETKNFGVVFPDLPGCVSAGRTYEEAFQMAHEALSLYADGNDKMPEPRTLEEIKSHWEYWHEWKKNYTFYISEIALYSLKSRFKKFNISMDERLVTRIDRVTKNRSAFITQAVEQLLRAGSAAGV